MWLIKSLSLRIRPRTATMDGLDSYFLKGRVIRRHAESKNVCLDGDDGTATPLNSSISSSLASESENCSNSKHGLGMESLQGLIDPMAVFL